MRRYGGILQGTMSTVDCIEFRLAGRSAEKAAGGASPQFGQRHTVISPVPVANQVSSRCSECSVVYQGGANPGNTLPMLRADLGLNRTRNVCV